MNIVITGLASVYEPENVARLFYPQGRLLAARPAGRDDLVLARAGRRHLLAAVRENGRCAWLRRPLAPGQDPEYALTDLVYQLLVGFTGVRPPWGSMTGVRPVRIIHDSRARGLSEEEIRARFVDRYHCTEEKYRLALSIADLQRPVMAAARPRDCSLYIGIPFCPSRCSYCSFVSRTIEREHKLVQPYVDALCREIEEMRRQIDACGLTLKTIYIGGGTPTSLSADQLRQLLHRRRHPHQPVR